MDNIGFNTLLIKLLLIVNDLLIIHPDEDCPKADAIVVTAVTAFIEIDEFLYEKVDCPIISLEDIIYSGGMTK